jgi:hypothetical protein
MEILRLQVQGEHIRQHDCQGGGNFRNHVRLEISGRSGWLEPPKFCFSKVHDSDLLLVR